MTIFWITCSVIFYIAVLFTRDYIQRNGNDLEKTLRLYMFNHLAEIAGLFSGGILSYKMGARNSLSFSYSLVAFGSLLLFIIET